MLKNNGLSLPLGHKHFRSFLFTALIFLFSGFFIADKSSATDVPGISSYTLNSVAASATVNPLTHPVQINFIANMNADWTSIKIENATDASIYKIFYPTSCDGAIFCNETWNGDISASGKTLIDGNYRIKIHIKDSSNSDNQFYDYLIPYVINVDTTAPTGQAIVFFDQYYTSASVDIRYISGSDSGSGLNLTSGKLQRESATLSAGKCGAYGGFYDLLTGISTGSYTDNSVVTGNCYKYQYLIFDNAGNSGVFLCPKTAKIDTDAPVTTDDAPTVWKNTNVAVTLTATDGVSGVSSTAYCVYDAGKPECNPTIIGNSVLITCAANSACRQIVRYYSADNSGNTAHLPNIETAHDSAVVQIDRIPPEISGTPADMTVDATNSHGAVVTYNNPTATDYADETDPVVCMPSSGSTFAFGKTVVYCNAHDSAGNYAIQTGFNVTVQDKTPPTIETHGDVIFEATSSLGAIADYVAPFAVDLADGSFPAACLPASGSLFGMGDTIVHCNATDTHGNEATETEFKVAVKDTVPPIITLNGLVSINLVVGDTYTEAGANAVDAVDGSREVVISGDVVNTAAAAVFHVKYNATDAAGNSAIQAIRTVTVSDINAPIVNKVGDINVEASGPAGAIATYGAVFATDDTDEIIPATCAPVSGSIFPIGSTAIICTATDSSGNVGNGIGLNIVVLDLTPPTLVVTPASQTVEAKDASGGPAIFSATASDLVDGDLSSLISCNKVSGENFKMGDTVLICSVTDAHGNKGTGTAVVSIKDTTPPIITLLGVSPVTIAVGSIYTDSGSTATDNIDGNISASIKTANTVDSSKVGTYIVAYDVSDSSGNTAVEIKRTVNVVLADDTLKVLATPVGTLSPAFDPAVLKYSVTLPAGTIDIPDITAEASDTNATVDNKKASNFAELTTIKVTARDGITSQSYSVSFTVITEPASSGSGGGGGGSSIVNYTISSSAGANGRIYPSGLAYMNYGSSKTYAINPDPGYRIEEVLVDGFSKGSITTYTFDNIIRDHTISATFSVFKAPELVMNEATEEIPSVIKNNETGVIPEFLLETEARTSEVNIKIPPIVETIARPEIKPEAQQSSASKVPVAKLFVASIGESFNNPTAIWTIIVFLLLVLSGFIFYKLSAKKK